MSRTTAASDASSTARHTAVSRLPTSGTEIMPSTSAAPIRASSARRRDRAAAMTRSGVGCRAADAVSAEAMSETLAATSSGPSAPSVRSGITSGFRMSNSATNADVPSTRTRRRATMLSSRSVRRNQVTSSFSSHSRR